MNALEHSVGLVAIAVPGGRLHGTGFCVAKTPQGSWFLTCAHVVAGRPHSEFRVNGFPVREIVSGAQSGLDLALLNVDATHFVPLEVGELSQSGKLRLFGYRNLYREEFIRNEIVARAVEEVLVQGRMAKSGIRAVRFECESGAVELGFSGAPMLAHGGKVAAVVTSKLQDREGLAISLQGAVNAWEELGSLIQGTRSTSEPAASEGERGTKIYPELMLMQPYGTDPDDTNRGRFGGKAKSTEVKLEVRLRAVHKSYFVCDAIVKSLSDTVKIGPARFYLHETFPRSVIDVRKVRADGSLVLEEITAYGAFVLGCRVVVNDDHIVALEYDLAKLPKLTKKLKEQ